MLAGWGIDTAFGICAVSPPPTENGIVICFLQAARAGMTGSISEMQDKLIISVHNKVQKRHEELLHTTEKRSRAVEMREDMGKLVLEDSIPDNKLRKHIFELLPSKEIGRRPSSLAFCEALVCLYAEIFTRASGEDAFQFAQGSPLGVRSFS